MTNLDNVFPVFAHFDAPVVPMSLHNNAIDQSTESAYRVLNAITIKLLYSKYSGFEARMNLLYGKVGIVKNMKFFFLWYFLKINLK